MATAFAQFQTVADRLDEQRDAGVLPGHVEQTGSRAEGWWAEARAAVGHEKVFIGGVGPVHRSCLLLQLRVIEIQVRRAERRHLDTARIVGNRLGRIDHLARHVRLGFYRRLDDRVNRLARLTMPEIQQAVLTGRGDALDGLTVLVRDVEQGRTGDVVPVPEVMMDGLEVPAERAGLEIQRDRRVGEQVLSDTRRAVVRGIGISGVEIDQSERGVDRRLGPDAASHPFAVAPRRIGDLPALVLRPLRDRVEHPLDGAGDRVRGNDEPPGDIALGDC